MPYDQDRGLGPYLAYCAERGARAIPADDAVYAAFLLTRAGGARTAMGYSRRSIERAHRQAGLPVPQLHPEVRAVERLHFPPPRLITVTDRDVAAILAALDMMAPTDARDGAAIIIAHVHGWNVDEIRAIRVEDLRFVEGGVRIGSETLADGAEDTSLAPWLRAWMLHLRRESGALFAAWHAKGYWTASPLTHFAMYRNIRVAAIRGGIVGRGPGNGRKGPAIASMAAALRRRAR